MPETSPPETRFWMIRHALVEENARSVLYGVMDVELCPTTLEAQVPMYQALARRLPRPARWLVSPLSRTRRTAEAIMRAGYPATQPGVEPGLIEQNLGDWQGLKHAALPALLRQPAHPFWPVSGREPPPNGEAFSHVIERVGPTLDRLADEHEGHDVVAVSHGGTIRAAVAHAMGIEAEAVLRMSIQNLSLTRLDRIGSEWRVVCVNEVPGF